MPSAEWRVGILFSRSGVTTITESEHFFGTALAIEEINQAGGVLGKPIIPVVHDPAGDNTAYRNLARKLLAEDEVNVIFGCSMSASRKAVLPIIERHNGLLFYPSMYEGFEYSENVVYTGTTPNQNIFPLAEYLLKQYGARIYLIGADYIYPRESNRVMREIIESKGGQIVAEHYFPLDVDEPALRAAVADISRAAPDAVFSTLIGRPAQTLYRLYAQVGMDPRRCPIASLTMAETEIREIGVTHCHGHILSASYFQTIEGEQNREFVRAYKGRFGPEATTSVWSQPAYAQVHLFARALAKTGSLDTHRISQALLGEELNAPDGRISVDSETRHLWLTPRIGVARADGLFDIVWQAPGPVRPDPYLTSSRIEDIWMETGA